jgi:hypothetical protein
LLDKTKAELSVHEMILTRAESAGVEPISQSGSALRSGAIVSGITIPSDYTKMEEEVKRRMEQPGSDGAAPPPIDPTSN